MNRIKGTRLDDAELGGQAVLSLYQAFVQTVESETLVEAAAVLHTTQPTLTRQIQQLESALGMPLFNRISRRLVINRAGELVYAHAKRIILTEQRMLDELAAFGNPEQGLIAVGAGLTPSIYILPTVFAAYQAAHSGVRFQVVTGSSRTVLQALAQREVDLGVVTSLDAQDAELVVTPLWRDELVLVAPPLHALVGRTVDFRELAEHPFVLMRRGSGLRKMIASLADAHHIELDVTMETDSLESINRIVQSGVGLSVLPASSVQDDIESGRLVALELADGPLGARTISLVVRKDSGVSAATHQFVETLPELARLHHGWLRPVTAEEVRR